MKNFLLIMLLAAAGAGSAFAHHESGGRHSKQAPAATTGQKTGKGAGLIQQIDRDKGVITIKHGPLQGLNMPGMTMSFLVKDKTMLSSLQPLQKVEFELTYDGRRYLVTHIR